jgi:hypothetical protein
MGQQQLFPLLLATIVVGIAIVVGMEMFANESRTAEQDEIRQRLVEVAGRAQDWYRRPRALGGGDRSFARISWRAINMDPSTVHAKYTMTSKAQNRFLLTAASTSDTTLSMSYFVYADSVVLQP